MFAPSVYLQGTYVNQQVASGSPTYSNLDKVCLPQHLCFSGAQNNFAMATLRLSSEPRAAPDCSRWCNVCNGIEPTSMCRMALLQTAMSDTMTAADFVTRVMQTSITNLQPKSNAMYADWISVWVISLFLYWVSRSLTSCVSQPCHL